MNIHEYQAQTLMTQFGVATVPAKMATTPDEAQKIAESLDTNRYVVKAQIHSGGRGKGVFKNGFQGGVHLASSSQEVHDLARKMLGETLVTKQTGEAGRVVRKVLVGQSVEIQRELYFAILVDRESSQPMVVASTQGGMNIEEVAEKTPHAIIREPIHPTLGFQPFQARKLAKKLGFSSSQLRLITPFFSSLYQLFLQSDCSLVEINPLVETTSGEIYALDAKINFDDNALFRHPELAEMRDLHEEDPREVEASKYHLNYIGLEGNIACLVNGAGLAMSTMDIIQHYGGQPANFLDVGGSASEEQVTEAFKILCGDPNVQAILVNIFGGIMKCDIIAQGIINACKAVALSVPLVVRLEGTHVENGKKLLEQSGLQLITADNLADAAEKAVRATQP